MSLKMVPFESLGKVSYSQSIVTKTVLVSFMRYNEILVKIANFSYPLAFNTPVRGFPSEYCHNFWYGKTRMVKNVRRYVYLF